MKKALLTAGLILAAGAAFAQKGVTSIGGQLSYGSDIEKFGIGAQVRHGFTKEIRGAASLNYYFKESNMSAWDINANLHYLFPLDKQFTVYPLAGLTYLRVKYHGPNGFSSSHGKLGVNLGGGIDYKLSSNWALVGELKYQIISNYAQLVPSVGVTYSF